MAKSTKKQQTETSQPTSEKQRGRERAQLLKKQKQRRKMTNIAIGLGLFAIVAVAMIFFANQPADAPIPEGTAERYAQLPQLRTENNFYRLGNPAAPVQVVEYASYTCPACLNFYESGMETIVDLVRQGVISYTFIPRFVGAYQNAEGAARAAFCAGEQGKYFELHDALFAWQTQYGNTAFTQNRLLSGAEELGLNVGDFRSCLTSGRANSHISNADQEATSRGFIGAPITTVNGTQVNTNINEVVSYVYTMQGNQPARPPQPVDETLPPSTGNTDAEPTEEATADVTEEAVEEETNDTTVDETDSETVTPEATATEEVEASAEDGE
jgi:protein-disulfide isomerase